MVYAAIDSDGGIKGADHCRTTARAGAVWCLNMGAPGAARRIEASIENVLPSMRARKSTFILHSCEHQTTQASQHSLTLINEYSIMNATCQSHHAYILSMIMIRSKLLVHSFGLSRPNSMYIRQSPRRTSGSPSQSRELHMLYFQL